MSMDRDLQSLQEVRDLLQKAHDAQKIYKEFSQEQVDRVCEAMVEAGWQNSRYLAELACEETGMGRPDSKHLKNFVGTRLTWEDIKDLKTCGVIRQDDVTRVYELADPYGVVAAIIPTTNPTSTAMFKILISLKTRNSIVISPHPRAIRCVVESARIMHEAAVRAGAPEGLVQTMTTVTLQGTQHLMEHRLTDVIVATGGSQLVTAAYSAGNPAYGVGPGNVPVYIHQSADIPHAVACISVSQTFDNGTICSSEQSVICDERIGQQVLDQFRRQGSHVCSPEETAKLERVCVRGHMMNPEVVGLFPRDIAAKAGFTVPHETKVLIVPYRGVGRQYPLSCEILAPLLTFYAENGEEACRQRCHEILADDGLGHSFGIHATEEQVIWRYAHEIPTYRFHVNAPTTQASVGYAVKIEPSMTLGCGAPGKNITGDNITARHLMNIKRVGFIDPAFDAEHVVPTYQSGAAAVSASPAPAPSGQGQASSQTDFTVNNTIKPPVRPYLMDKHNPGSDS